MSLKYESITGRAGVQKYQDHLKREEGVRNTRMEALERNKRELVAHREVLLQRYSHSSIPLRQGSSANRKYAS